MTPPARGRVPADVNVCRLCDWIGATVYRDDTLQATKRSHFTRMPRKSRLCLTSSYLFRFSYALSFLHAPLNFFLFTFSVPVLVSGSVGYVNL